MMANLLKSNAWRYLVLFSTLLLACEEDDGPAPVVDQTPLASSTNNMVDFISGEVLGTTRVERFEDKINVQVNTSNLIPGHVYNLFVATIDQPENCLTQPCTYECLINKDAATRPVFFLMKRWVSSSDTENYGNSIREKDVSSFEIYLGGFTDDFGGLQDASNAEVHILIRSSGPVTGDEAQLSTVQGACTVDYTFGHPEPKIPMNQGECGWIQQSVHVAP